MKLYANQMFSKSPTEMFLYLLIFFQPLFYYRILNNNKVPL